MEIRDIDSEYTHAFSPAPRPKCVGSRKWGDHDYCDGCDGCGHPSCDYYVEEHHGKGLREEKTPPAPGSLGSSLKLEQVRFRIIGRGGFRTEHVGNLVRIYGEKIFHVALTSDGTIEIYYCGKIESVDKY